MNLLGGNLLINCVSVNAIWKEYSVVLRRVTVSSLAGCVEFCMELIPVFRFRFSVKRTTR